jgi:hypothetical protein
MDPFHAEREGEEGEEGYILVVKLEIEIVRI